MLSTNLSSNTLIPFSFYFPWSSRLLNLCWILQFTRCIVHIMSPQSYLTLCDPMDCSPPGSSVHRILQARILKWVAMHSSRGSSGPRDQTRVLHYLHLQTGSLPLAPPGKTIHLLFSFKISGWRIEEVKVTQSCLTLCTQSMEFSRP